MNTYEKINTLVSSSQKGNKKSLEVLLEILHPLLCSKCKHYFGYVDDDLYQNGVMRTLELIYAFDFDKNTRFLGYMKFMLSCFYWELKKEELKGKEKERLTDAIHEEKEYVEDFEDLEMKEIFSVLNEKELKVIQKHILYGHTLIEVSKSMNISYNWAKQLKYNGLKKLKNFYADLSYKK